jgi:hypothetical protein
MTYTYALFFNALINKVGIFVLAAICLYFGFKLLGHVELQKLRTGEALTAQLGSQIKIMATKLLPGSIFIVAAAVMVVIAYKSELQFDIKDGNASFIGRGLGPEVNANETARARLVKTLGVVIGIVSAPTSQFPETDVRALKDARPDLETLKAALEKGKP